MPHTRARGAVGEEAAEAYLVAQGYRVVERNVASKLGEIDLVALDGETLVFVEVKARASAEFGAAIEAVGPRKRRRLARAAAMFLAKNRSQRPCRFDVLGLDRGADGAWTFTLVRDAFQLG
ncbi:MAG TPA: YraN family protein [Thermoanaerobaculia bacterium]